jgi:uncharacterized protein (TIGR03382 family)
MRYALTCTGIAALFALSGAAAADVRVVHASPDAPNVDVYVNGDPTVDDPAIVDLGFTAATPYISLPTDTYNFKVTPTGADSPVVIDADVAIDDTMDYTVAATDFLANITPIVYVDDNTIDPDNARIRFIHLSPDAPAVDIFAAPYDPGDTPLFDAVSFQDSGGYISVPGGTYDLQVRLDGTGDLALDVPGLSVMNGNVYTVFAMGSVADGSLQAVPVLDIPAPGTAALFGVAGLLGVQRRRR